MTKLTKIQTKFFRFLKENNVYREYIEYVSNPKYFENAILTRTSYRSGKDFIFSNSHAYEWIQHAFAWRRTKEGHDFWSKVNAKWVDIQYFYFSNNE